MKQIKNVDAVLMSVLAVQKLCSVKKHDTINLKNILLI